MASRPYKFKPFPFAIPPLIPPDSPVMSATPPANTEAITQEPLTLSGLLALPTEIQLLILQHTLRHHNPLPIHPDFTRHDVSYGPPADYRILHSCRDLYCLGLSIYYATNVFSIDLAKFNYKKTFEPEIWPVISGFEVAAEEVRVVHVRAREFSGNWVWAVRCLRGFVGLEKIVFDTRNDRELDDGPGGVKVSGIWTREARNAKNRQTWTGSYDLIEVPLTESSILRTLLQKAGIKVGKGGIWAGAETEEDAGRPIRRKLVPSVIRAFTELEELQGAEKEGVPRLKEYGIWLEAQMEDQEW